jgi:peptidylprolyl isomerase/FKBP-type peptidyl-prolyl cis-trans isomerase SlyD
LDLLLGICPYQGIGGADEGVKMKSGDWILINFLGQVKATGEVFDLTKEEDARKHDLYDEEKKYGPVLVIVSGGMIIPGVEKHLLEMRIGETKEFDVPPAEALGPRRPELMRVFSIAKFMQQKITPFPGLVLNIDGRNAKVLSVAGGRVRMDFNHPLAGKELHYRIEIVELVKETKKQIESLLRYYNVEGKVTITGKKASISPEKEPNPMIKKLIEETLKKWCPGVGSINFLENKAKAGEAEKPGEKKPERENSGQGKP